MSRFAKIAVKIPQGVKVDVTPGMVRVNGPKGNLERKFPNVLDIKIDDSSLIVNLKEKNVTKFDQSIQGTVKSHIVNMIIGVTSGWSKKLELQGTGYRAEVRGTDLILTVGFSHPVTVEAPAGIKFTLEKNVITIDGIDKEVVGALAAKIKAVRPPDPYKGKGIRYLGEYLKLKPGKQAAKTTT
jgi:large subunit ribosomal protein L6